MRNVAAGLHGGEICKTSARHAVNALTRSAVWTAEMGRDALAAAVHN